MAKTRTVYVCSICGNESLKWLGRCPQCGEWNTYVEKTTSSTGSAGSYIAPAEVQELAAISLEDVPRIPLNSSEFNCVLGGGNCARFIGPH